MNENIKSFFRFWPLMWSLRCRISKASRETAFGQATRIIVGNNSNSNNNNDVVSRRVASIDADATLAQLARDERVAKQRHNATLVAAAASLEQAECAAQTIVELGEARQRIVRLLSAVPTTTTTTPVTTAVAAPAVGASSSSPSSSQSQSSSSSSSSAAIGQ